MTFAPLSRSPANGFRPLSLPGVRRLLARWRRRPDLADVGDRLLADIGVTREEVRRECAVPFWR